VTWNEAAFRILDMSSGGRDGAELLAEAERRMGCRLPAAVRDALLRGVDDAMWSFDHEVPRDAAKDLAALLRQGPTTYGWAHNQGCDAVYRFDGKARVSVALADGAAVWTATAAPDPELRTVIVDTLCIPASDR